MSVSKIIGIIVLISILIVIPSYSSLAAKDPVIMAVGDIACDPKSWYFNNGNGSNDNCQMKATANIVLKRGGVSAVLPLGDNQYQDGTYDAYQKSYDPTWGQLKRISYPVPGNHEYYTPNATGYYKYYGARAGDPSKGYYSYNLGSWHLIALNSNCEAIGGCGFGSPQEKWLRADLAKNKNFCMLAYWHHPRFSSGVHGNNPDYDAFWQDLYNAKVEVVLNGHVHNYERFAPQTPQAKADPKFGIRQFVVGTGGKNFYDFVSIEPNSQVRNNNSYGVLEMILEPKGYRWKFIGTSGKTFSDRGRDDCH